MNASTVKVERRRRRKAGVRRRVLGRPDQPRLSIFRSSRHIYAQIIDDLAGRTLVAASSMDKARPAARGSNRAGATAVGKLLAQRAVEAGIGRVVFDRNGYRYHGRIKALAEAAREGGLKF
jgi:large subunit ribosomal protein L18